MCGIAGVLGGAKIDTIIVKRITRALAHRGPDDQGVWVDVDALQVQVEDEGVGFDPQAVLDLCATEFAFRRRRQADLTAEEYARRYSVDTASWPIGEDSGQPSGPSPVAADHYPNEASVSPDRLHRINQRPADGAP